MGGWVGVTGWCEQKLHTDARTQRGDEFCPALRRGRGPTGGHAQGGHALWRAGQFHRVVAPGGISPGGGSGDALGLRFAQCRSRRRRLSRRFCLRTSSARRVLRTAAAGVLTAERSETACQRQPEGRARRHPATRCSRCRASAGSPAKMRCCAFSGALRRAGSRRFSVRSGAGCWGWWRRPRRASRWIWTARCSIARARRRARRRVTTRGVRGAKVITRCWRCSRRRRWFCTHGCAAETRPPDAG